MLNLLATPAAGQDLEIAPNVDPLEMVTDRFVMAAKSVVLGTTNRRPDQWERGRILMELAQQLNPDDPEIWRLRTELSAQIGDKSAHIELLQRYCKLVPSDDAAQLELIMAKVAQHQVLEERMRLVRAILAHSGAKHLTKPLRSRLASYVAQAAGELNDDELFRQYLADAIRLDQTNQHAAQMSYDDVLARKAPTTLAVGSAMMLRIQAKPFDAQPRLDYARFLMSQSYYEPAQQQFAVAARFRPLLFDNEALFDWCLCLAASGNYDEAISFLYTAEEALNTRAQGEAAQEKAQAEREGQTGPDEGSDVTPESEPQPDIDAPPSLLRLTLPIDLELLRLAIFHKSGYEAKADGAYGRIRQQLLERIEQQDEQAKLDLVWLSVLFNRHEPQEQIFLAELANAPERDESWLRRVRAWIALNEGLTAKARDILDPLLGQVGFADYGVGLSHADVPALSIEYLQTAVTSAYSDLVGMLAAMELNQLQVEPRPTADGPAIRETYEQWPHTFRDPIPAETPLIRLDIALSQQRYRYLDPIIATLRMTNAAEVSFSLGRGEAIPTNAIVIASPQIVGEVRDLPPDVVDLKRRLVIDPGQSIEVKVRLDRSPLGGMLAYDSTTRVGFSLMAMLDPRPQRGERLGVSNLGAVDYERFIERQGIEMTVANVNQWIADLNDADPAERLRTMARLCQISIRIGQQESEELKVLSARITDGINNHFPDLHAYEQAWTLFFIPIMNEEAQEVFAPALNMAKRSDEPLVRIAYLFRQVNSTESPDLDAGVRHSNPMISQFAKAHRTAIEKAQEEFSRAREEEQQRQPPQR